MSLAAGTRLGVYEVLGLIGAGGMGEVYKAKDTHLNRTVAIKVLPESLAADIERLARFEREARTLAALNHPNITQIHGFEASDGVKALVMELVDGTSLADRIAHGSLSVDETLQIAKQIAEALEAAHEQAIVHRDLKPANVRVRPDGVVKVLDFGLAKALEPASAGNSDAAASPTITSPAMMTRMGVILGTAAYMSPEQAKGRLADKRSDVWAFGCVLYEMITGRRAFQGEDVSDTLAAVLRGEPDWTALSPEVSRPIVALIRGCLEKDWRKRIGDLSTARFIIEHEADAPAGVGPPVVSRMRRSVSMVAVATSTAVIAAYATLMVTRRLAPPLPVARSTIPLPMGDRFSNTGVHVVAFSPDGRRLAYAANGRLYLRMIDRLEATPIRGTEGADEMAGRGAFFSPDGLWVGFWQGGRLKKVSINGGTPVVLCAAENPWGASWASDNTILYGQSNQQGASKGNEGIWRVSSGGGTPERLVKLQAGEVAESPQMLRGGRAILFTVARPDDWDTARIVVQSLDTNTRQVLLERGIDARYVPTGHLVYAIDGTLFAVPFDVSRLALTGPAVPLVEDVAQQNVTVQFAISNEGALVYVPRDAVLGSQAQRVLVWVDRQGRETAVAAPPRAYGYPRLSPDATRVALEVRGQEQSIWVWDLARKTLTRLTFGPKFQRYAVWTPDGRSVIFSSGERGSPTTPRSLFRRRADGTGTVEQLTQSAIAQFPQTVTPDGTLIVREQRPPTQIGGTSQSDFVVLRLDGEHHVRPLVQTPFGEYNAEVSPDGHWLAYEASDSGRFEVYVRPFPNVDGGKWQVSTNGGAQPLWARSGHELFYESRGALMSVPVTIGSTFTAGTPRKILDSGYLLRIPAEGPGRMYDASPDGQQFLMLKESRAADEQRPLPRMILVENWFEELKAKVPTK